ncbi:MULTISPECIES: hypothetical protein [unclassified Pseudomonas]|uniref:hypothetical protein n=1 Tax=unclassified Pseudomonas TaxID=196821 RepID=UPI00244C4262|nr:MULTISPECIES: hypothetical protein [unclassified Pseudomonas]MDG9923534.1 hypothetical protein [Pseudomonas sp. GD04045]MDH0036296.1 hypothetical protein [Pseudomonas sp. GD04019]
MENNTDRRVATATPLLVLLLNYLIGVWLFWLLPPLMYFFYRKRGWLLARELSLKLTDLHLSLLVLAVPLGLLLGALGIVANDAEMPRWPLEILTNLLIIALGIYILISYVFFVVKAYKGQLHSPKLNMGIIEAMRGKRAAQQPADQPTVD